MIDVPAHIEYAPQMRNGVLHTGGSNWDLSRGAAASPARALAEPRPEPPRAPAPGPALTRYGPDSGLAGREPVLVMTFASGRSAVGRTEAKTLCTLRTGQFTVAGHAHPDERNARELAQARADAVARALRSCGLRVVRSAGFGASLPAPADGAQARRRVEVFGVSR